MRNNLVVLNFVTRDINCKAANLTYSNGKLYSYSTCVAKWVGGKVFINSTHYSKTTTAHINLLKKCLKNFNISYCELPVEDFNNIDYMWRG